MVKRSTNNTQVTQHVHKGKKPKHRNVHEFEETSNTVPENNDLKNGIQKIANRRNTGTRSLTKSQLAGDVLKSETEPLYTPTLDELSASNRPENMLAVVTGRQKKKKKQQQQMEAKRAQHSGNEMKRNKDYLCRWRDTPEEWKFEKLRQISIQQSIFDEQKIDGDLWPVALLYLSKTKGAAKASIVQLAESVIDQLDKESAEYTGNDKNQFLSNSPKYQRARNLLQSFA